MGWWVLPPCKDAKGAFYSLSWQGFREVKIKFEWKKINIKCIERGLDQSSGMTWRGGRKGKVEWLIDRLVAPKRPSPVREIWRRILVWIQPALEPDHWGQPAPGRSLTRKKEKRKSENWEPVKDKYNSNRFPSTILKYWKVIYIKRKRDSKDSISPIIKFIEWTLLQASVWRLRHCYSSKRKRKEKKRKKKKDCWETILFDISCWLNIAGILKRKEKRRKNSFLNLIIICLVIAH